MASRREAVARLRAVEKGSACAELLLESADDTAERASGNPDEGDGHGEEGDDVGLEAKIVPAADVGADGHGPSASAASAVSGFIGAATES
jgi:hypothetical protein